MKIPKKVIIGTIDGIPAADPCFAEDCSSKGSFANRDVLLNNPSEYRVVGMSKVAGCVDVLAIGHSGYIPVDIRSAIEVLCHTASVNMGFLTAKCYLGFSGGRAFLIEGSKAVFDIDDGPAKLVVGRTYRHAIVSNKPFVYLGTVYAVSHELLPVHFLVVKRKLHAVHIEGNAHAEFFRKGDMPSDAHMLDVPMLSDQEVSDAIGSIMPTRLNMSVSLDDPALTFYPKALQPEDAEGLITVKVGGSLTTTVSVRLNSACIYSAPPTQFFIEGGELLAEFKANSDGSAFIMDGSSFKNQRAIKSLEQKHVSSRYLLDKPAPVINEAHFLSFMREEMHVNTIPYPGGSVLVCSQAEIMLSLEKYFASAFLPSLRKMVIQ